MGVTAHYRMRMWRNWQTRRFQVPVGNSVWVQIPSSAPKKSTRRGVLFWYDNRNMKGFDGGAANESERCASEVVKERSRKAQATINNCRAGRAAKGANPSLCAIGKTLSKGAFFIVFTPVST